MKKEIKIQLDEKSLKYIETVKKNSENTADVINRTLTSLLKLTNLQYDAANIFNKACGRDQENEEDEIYDYELKGNYENGIFSDTRDTNFLYHKGWFDKRNAELEKKYRGNVRGQEELNVCLNCGNEIIKSKQKKTMWACTNKSCKNYNGNQG